MYKDHATFIIDKTKNLPYWRYMDFWKFLQLVNTSKLYFPNVEMLGDQHEGKIPAKIYQMMLDEDKRLGRTNNFAKNYKEYIENNLRSKTLVSSWSASPTESFAMWKMYAKEKLGIGIKTNFERLKVAFKNAEEHIYIGEVQYYDDEHPSYTIGNTFTTFLVKHIYYKFEAEVRCITEIKDTENVTSKNITVDLNSLIEEVYISPFASQTGILEILEFIKSKNNLNFAIKISGVNDSWI